MILALDTGTTSMRGILFDNKGNTAFTSQKATSPRFPDTIRVEQDPLIWKDALLSILKECAAFLSANGKKLEGISVTAFRSPVFPADKDGTPLMPAIMWQDRRTDTLCEELADKSSLIYKKTGLPLTSVFSAVKMLWFIRNCPDVMQKTVKLAGVYDYLLFLLSGNFITDQSVASRFNLYDLKRTKWSPSLLNLFSLREDQLPEVAEPGSICGTLKKETADVCGLPEGIPIITGGGDQQCAALGLGITSPGKLAMNTGTGAYVIGLSDKVVHDGDEKIFCNISAIPGKYIVEANMLTAGTIYRWFSETFMNSDVDAKSRFSLIDSEIKASPVGSNGVILIPHFKGVRGNAAMKGAFLNLDLNTSRGDMGRSVLEGIAMELGEQLEVIEKMTGSIESVSVSGGMTRFDPYNQIQADCYNRSVTSWGDGEATALGAWMNGMMALKKAPSYDALWESMDHGTKKEFLPIKENTKIYTELKAAKKAFMKK